MATEIIWKTEKLSPIEKGNPGSKHAHFQKSKTKEKKTSSSAAASSVLNYETVDKSPRKEKKPKASNQENSNSTEKKFPIHPARDIGGTFQHPVIYMAQKIYSRQSFLTMTQKGNERLSLLQTCKTC